MPDLNLFCSATGGTEIDHSTATASTLQQPQDPQMQASVPSDLRYFPSTMQQRIVIFACVSICYHTLHTPDLNLFYSTKPDSAGGQHTPVAPKLFPLFNFATNIKSSSHPACCSSGGGCASAPENAATSTATATAATSTGVTLDEIHKGVLLAVADACTKTGRGGHGQPFPHGMGGVGKTAAAQPLLSTQHR